MIEVLCVIGHEGTGTEWMTWSLALHPQIHRVLHQSYPVDWNGSPYKRLTEYGSAKDGEWMGVPTLIDRTAPVVLMMRDQTCSNHSNRNRGFFKVDPNRTDRFRASEQMWHDVEEWKGPVIPCSYEGMVEETESYMRLLLAQIGVDPNAFPFTLWYDKKRTKPVDQNRKYWRMGSP